ncbi:MAG TPA: dockerin type I domain-containing protein [Thermoanaerobaculia bacterium]|nr:dockerin type I domain-containing protein [Thermoanaerobaculia bacterium]
MNGLGNVVVTWDTGSDVHGRIFCSALAGDFDNSAGIDVADVFYLINHLFAGGPTFAQGSGDVNGDGLVDVADVFYLINYLFAGGPGPACKPHPV